ncbi:MAG TPA: pantoate--beta-alanine ligase [Saprospiraceae bacterium]|nr:pantoate--beta-alanine ligase [Saprospiraceae bacterium]
MQYFVKHTTLKNKLDLYRKNGKTIGFIPTMGALHDGHLKLVHASVYECDISVCSIFVNPTQFNDVSDLVKYPRNLPKDSALLKAAGLDILFAPTILEVYPNGMDIRVDIDLEGLDTILEGAFRPGHFKGVVQIVKRLLDMVQPDVLYMGQKDFQQFTIIRHMIKTLHLPVKLVVIPTEREPGGLAMSSRNERLSAEYRKKARVIFETLNTSKTRIEKDSLVTIKSDALKKISDAGLIPEYFEIVDGNTLQVIHDPSQHEYIVGLAAAWAGDVRLIDNLIFRGKN